MSRSGTWSHLRAYRVASAALACVVLAAAPGCDPGLGAPTGSLPPEVAGALATDSDASARLDAALAAGTPAPAALATLLAELQQNQSVAAAVMNAEGTAIWAVFRSGVNCTYEAIDLDAGYSLNLNHLALNGAAPAEPEYLAPAASKPAFAGPHAPSILHAAMPGNHRAVVASSIAACAPETMHWGSDRLAQGARPLLERLGYVVFSTQASVEFFERLSQRQCSVVFIDARGWLRNTDEMLRALVAPDVFGAGGLNNTRHMLMTSTSVTPELEQRYSADLANGRLVIRNPKYREGGRWHACGRYFGVTPAFVRLHDTGRYPDRTILILNASNMIDPAQGATSSEWYTLLREKSNGAYMVGWSGEPSYPRSVTAMANLLELCTGADYRYVLTAENNEVNTQPISPPVNALDVTTAVASPMEGGTRGAVQTGTGIGLLMLWDELGRWGNGFSLAPQLRDLYIDRDSNARLFAATIDNAQLHVNASGVAGTVAIDIGSVSPTLDWRFKIPVGAAGPISLRLADGRRSAGLTLFTWKPAFTADGTAPLGLTYRKTYQMVARGLVAPRWRGVQDPNVPWSSPQSNDIIADFDSGGCVATWSVSGTYVDENARHTYSGGGTKVITFPPGLGAGSVQLGGSFTSTPVDLLTATTGPTIDADISPDERFTMEYTEAVENLLTREVQVYQRQLLYLDLRIERIPIDGNLVLQAGSRVLDRGNGYNETVSWPACAPSPTFDPQRERR